jgi:hypothetical protein
MPRLSLPEIETFAERDPLLYEVLYRLGQAYNQLPVMSGGEDPNAAGVASTPNSLFIQSDPNGAATGYWIGVPGQNGAANSWAPLSTITTPATPASTAQSPISAIAVKYLPPGRLLVQGIQFDNQGRIASAFFSNPNDSTGLITTQPLTQNGTTTAINVAANTWQFGEFTVSYNSGSVDPGAFGAYDVFMDDVTYAGGAVIYRAALHTTLAAIAKRGRMYLGTITTAGGGGGTGGGGGSGCPLQGTEIIPCGGAEFKATEKEEQFWMHLIVEAPHRKFELYASATHNLYTAAGVKRLEFVVPGDMVVTCDGEFPVKSCELKRFIAKKLIIEVPVGHLYFANGILSHNKLVL